MRAHILTEGGGPLGFGHITRCLALGQALNCRGVTVKYHINGEKPVLDLVRGFKAVSENWLDRLPLVLEGMADADLIVVDSYEAAHDDYLEIADSGATAVYIDDTCRLSYPPGIVLNGTVYAGSLPYPESDDLLYLLGPDHILLRMPFWNTGTATIKERGNLVMIPRMLSYEKH